MTRPSPDERGIALAVAVFALTVMGALVAANFHAGRLEQESGRNALYAGQAAEAAEAGLSDASVALEPAVLENLGMSDSTLDLGTMVLGQRVVASRQLRRVGQNLFLLRATGVRHDAAGNPLATRSLGLLLNLTRDTLGQLAARPLRHRAWVQLH